MTRSPIHCPVRFSGRLARQLRETAGLTVLEVSRRVGATGLWCTPKRVEDIEAGKVVPRVEVLGVYANVLGVKVDDMLEEGE